MINLVRLNFHGGCFRLDMFYTSVFYHKWCFRHTSNELQLPSEQINDTTIALRLNQRLKH